MHYTDQQDFSIKLSYSMSRLLFVFSFSLREKKEIRSTWFCLVQRLMQRKKKTSAGF